MAERNGGGKGLGKRGGGPRTRRGKRRSSLNALKHGLRSKRPEAAGLNTAAFRAYRWRLERSWKPTSEPERFLARRFADISWRLIQSAEEEVRIFNEASAGVPGPRGWAQVFLKEEYGARLDHWMTRKAALDREMDQLIAALVGLRQPGAERKRPRETENSQTNSLDAELLDSLRKRAGAVSDGRDSRSFEGLPAIISRRPNIPN